ncbi:hypothetical protein Ciccas_006711 [Cichlidogyrus casuarinus]|uniref:Acetoacetyl-CoA synthetase n=1 Tax=Cichlidogyrus casuarinus TaxID=1844966 RepID=A0ABD2Q614_9PLAT
MLTRKFLSNNNKYAPALIYYPPRPGNSNSTDMRTWVLGDIKSDLSANALMHSGGSPYFALCTAYGSITLLKDPSQENEDICVCAWDGSVYVQNHRRETLHFSIGQPCQAFLAGQCAIVAGRNEPVLVFTTIQGSVLIYHNLNINRIPPQSILHDSELLQLFAQKGVDTDDKQQLRKSTNELPLWKPTISSGDQILQFMRFVETKFPPLKFENDYFKLHQWSIENTNDFWISFVQFAQPIYSGELSESLENSVAINQHPKWFPGCQVSYSENLLNRGQADAVAVYSLVEGDRRMRKRTFGELREEVAHFAKALAALGVESGDRVGAYLPNCLEALVAMLAVNSLGAIWSSTSTDFGVQGAVDRLGQLQLKMVIMVPFIELCSEPIFKCEPGKLASKLDCVTRTEEREATRIACLQLKQKLGNIAKSWTLFSKTLLEFLELSTGDGTIDYHRGDFSEAGFVLFSSGTTGKPKCIVHSAGGTLIKHLCEHRLHCDLQKNDLMFFFTTVGWMMWNWLVSALASGSGIVMYEGCTFQPDIWAIVDKLRVSVFGVSAKWLSEQNKQALTGKLQIEPHMKFDHLKAILSTGSPLAPDSFKFVYTSVKSNLMLGSISGGTDMIGCCLGCSTILPVHCGELQCKILGMAVESWDAQGHDVQDTPGDLIIKKAFPSMPVQFWNDADDKNFQAAYFNCNPGVWTHGDFIQVDSRTKGIVILGRSDGTLNPNGVRFGSAEIYHALETLDWVEDALCVAQANRDKTEERVLLFVKVKNSLTDDMTDKIRLTIRSKLSARHIPQKILQISQIPYTINGKRVEVPIRRLLEGAPANVAFSNKESLADATALEHYIAIVDELRADW